MTTPEEQNRGALAEAKRLSGLATADWQFQLSGSAEMLGIPVATLKTMVIANVKDREKTEREEKREQKQIDKQAERKEREEQKQIDKEAERKRKTKSKTFASMIKLPSDRHEIKLMELAKRLDEDVVSLRDEFSEFVGGATSWTPTTWDVEPWDEPVKTHILLQALSGKIRKHVVPKPFTGAEPTGPSIYRIVDSYHPTLIVDEADDLFYRKSDVNHIFNVSWTRGTKIPRMVQGVTHGFDPFCPKIVGLLGQELPRALKSRTIIIKLWPKTRDEHVEGFTYNDDDEFAVLRRELARWAIDNEAAIKALNPAQPASFNNRLMSNWRLLLAIAHLAGGDWPKRARQAAEYLSRTSADPSPRVRLLAAFQALLADGRKFVTSEDVIQYLHADPEGPWNNYRGKGPISKYEVAALLKELEIRPVVVHPTQRSNVSRHGYKREQFEDAFARYLPNLPKHPNIRTSKHKRSSMKKPSAKKSKRKRLSARK